MPENDLADVPSLGVEMARISLSGWNYTSQKPDDHPGSLKKMVQSYQAASDFADEMVGRLLDQLDKTGCAENTIIVLCRTMAITSATRPRAAKTTLWGESQSCALHHCGTGHNQTGNANRYACQPGRHLPDIARSGRLTGDARPDGQSLVPLLKAPQTKWTRSCTYDSRAWQPRRPLQRLALHPLQGWHRRALRL